MKIKFMLVCMLFVFFNAKADINSDLNKFFNSMNYSGSNYTKGAVWQSQAAGYLVGGGLYARTNVKTIQLASISAPSVSAGCGGIDLYLGSFSYINGAELIRFIKLVMSNSPGFAFDLALDTLVPELKSVKDYIQSITQLINDTSISSCQAAEALVGGVGVALGASKEYVCNSFGNQTSAFSDWVQSTMSCGVGGQANSYATKAQASPAFKDYASMINRNLTWYILTEKSGKAFLDNKEFKELVMTLMGTLIFKEEDIKTVLPSMGNKDIVKALLNGGQAKIYVCDEEKLCLNPQERIVNISDNRGLNRRVIAVISDIISKVENDSPELSTAEKDFIDSTTIPILKYILDPMSIRTTRSLIDDISKHISYDLLYQYLTGISQDFNIAAANIDLPKGVKNDLIELSKNSNAQLISIRNELTFQESQMLKLEEQMRYMREQASSNLISNYLSNYSF